MIFQGLRRVAMVAWCVALLFPGSSVARADGKVLAPVLFAQDVAMPDQRALLSWRDGVQTLVIESAFVGEGREFAWVVPVPSKPEVEAATHGTLSSAAALMLPRVMPASDELWWLVLLIAGVALVTLFAGWRAMGWVFRAAVTASLGLVLGAALASVIGAGWLIVPLAMLAGCWFLRDLIRKESSLFQHLLVLIVVCVLCLITVPTVGKVRSTAAGGPEAGGVVVEQSIVGGHDVAVLGGTKDEGVVVWLERNGYALAAEARVVAVEHAKAGGWFVASRVRRENAEAKRSVPAPLIFRFATPRPVYPMRFTGAGMTRPLELELYVFGPARAVVGELEAMAWAPLRFENGAGRAYRRGTGQPDDARVVTHPQLRRLTEGTAVVTRLRGRLSPEAMSRDLFPTWEVSGAPVSGLVARALEAAVQTAMALGGGCAFLASIILGFRFGGRRPPGAWSAAAIGVAVVAGAVLFARTPQVEVKETRGGMRWYDKRQIGQMAHIVLGELDPTTTTEDELRTALKQGIDSLMAQYDGAPMEFGDGPGQIELVRLPDGKRRLLVFDGAGQAGYVEGDDIEIGALRTVERGRP
jgi:hypothetical protein